MGTMTTDTTVKPLFADASPPSAQAIVIAKPQVITTTAIVVVTDEQIDKVGESNNQIASTFQSKMLSNVRASDADVMGDKLNQLIGIAKGLDPNKFAHGGILSKITCLFGNIKEKMLSEYQSVEKRMDSMVGEIDKTSLNQVHRITDLEEMFNLNVQVHNGYERDVETVKELVVELNAQLAQEQSVVNPDSFAAQRISDVQSRIQRAEIKIDNLERAKLLCKQLAPQIRLMQSNARLLTQKFSDIKVITLPAWKNVFTLYIVNIEQKKAGQLANAVDDATDAAFRAQADQLRQNTQEIGKAAQRAVVSIETIQHMQDQLIGSIDDMAKIAEEGRKARAAAAPQLQALEQQLVTKLLKK